MKITKAEFAGSSTRVGGKPARKAPEFAFIGRSNVGKSSLINMLTGNDVGFAVVLLTADDKGRKNYARKMQDRARQNVVFEMGYFMALLGRERVILLLQDGVEKPSDLNGVVYTALDKDGTWKYRLVKELREQGYKVSSDSL